MEAPILQIIVLQGPRNGEILVCQPESVIHIGRVMRGNNLALRDPGISQKHLCFRFIQKDSRWCVSDLDTSNGTNLNGSRIQASVPVPISDGDVLDIGEKTKLGVKIVIPAVVEGIEEGNNVRGRRITRRAGSSRVNLRSNSSRVSEEKQAESKFSAMEKGRTNNVRPISSNVSEEEEEKTLNPGMISDSGVTKGQKGMGRRRGNAVARNTSNDKEEKDSLEIEESDQNEEAKVRRNPRRSKSSRVLKEVDANRVVDSGSEIEKVDRKRKGVGRGRGKASAVSEEKENDVNLVLKLDSECTGSDHVVIPKRGKGKKERMSADSSIVIEEEGEMEDEEDEEDAGAEEERDSEAARLDLENMTLKEWFDSMEWFLPKMIHEESEKIIGILKEKAKRFDELCE